MASPSMTFNTALNALANQASLAASGNVTFDVDLSAKFEGHIQVLVTFGTVAATSGIQIDIYRRIGTGPAIDTESVTTLLISGTGSTSKGKSFALPTGRYRIKLSNLDATNAVTNVGATMDTEDGIA